MSMMTTSKKTLKLTWNISRYSDCIQTLGEGVLSPRFEIESLGPISWNLLFYPSGYKNPMYVACFLKQCDGYRNREAVVDFKICLNTENGTKSFSQTAENLLFKNGNLLGFPEFMTCKELQRCSFPNNILSLQFYISPSNDTSNFAADLIPLSNDIKQLYDETNFYDVIIRAGKTEFKVHKPLLFARFPSLINKIECSHYEESIPFVDISDFSPEIVKEVLHFVYTGKLTKFSKIRYHHKKLEEFSSKYGMVNLLSKLKWDVGECIMVSLIKITKTNHLLPLGHKVSKHFSISLLGNHSKSKVNFQYLSLACLEGININVVISTETSPECKYSLLAKFKGSIMSDKTLKCYERTFHINNFDSGKSESFPSHWFQLLIRNDTLPKNFHLEYLNCEWNISFSPSSIKTLPTFSDTLNCFSDDMYELFQQGIGTDLVLMTALDGKEFKVHKSVVCARVPSLMAMFKDDTLAVNGYVHNDIKNVKVEISGVDSDTFRAILKYIYSGKINQVSMNKVLQLYPKMVPTYMKQLQKQH